MPMYVIHHYAVMREVNQSFTKARGNSVDEALENFNTQFLNRGVKPPLIVSVYQELTNKIKDDIK